MIKDNFEKRINMIKYSILELNADLGDSKFEPIYLESLLLSLDITLDEKASIIISMNELSSKVDILKDMNNENALSLVRNTLSRRIPRIRNLDNMDVYSLFRIYAKELYPELLPITDRLQKSFLLCK